MSKSRDRRSTPRYAVARTPVFVAWQVEETHRIIYGKLCDLSLSGAAVLTDEPTPSSGLVWIRLHHREITNWIAADVVGVRRTRRIPLVRKSAKLVRLRFRESCPYEFFKAAVDGFASYCEIPDLILRELGSRTWR